MSLGTLGISGDVRLPGRYEDTELLAMGGSSWIFRACDAELRRHVGLKVFRQESPEDSLACQRKVLDIAGAVGTDCANLALPIGAGITDCGRAFIVHELVEDGSLHDAIQQRKALPPSEVISLGVGLCKALSTMHRAGYVHGDVTPANVLLRAGTEPVLTDLSSATEIGGPPLVSMTRGFSAPESVSLVTPKPPIDVYGLAQTLLVAYQGFADEAGEVTRDIDAAERSAVVVALGTRRARVLDGDEPLLQFLKRGVQPNPMDRPSVEEFTAGLMQLAANDKATEHKEAKPRGGSTRQQSSDRWAMAPVLGLMLLGSVLIAVLVVIGLRITTTAEQGERAITAGECTRLNGVVGELLLTSHAFELQAGRVTRGEAFDRDTFAGATRPFVYAMSDHARAGDVEAMPRLIEAAANFEDYAAQIITGETTLAATSFEATMQTVAAAADRCSGLPETSWDRFEASLARLGP